MGTGEREMDPYTHVGLSPFSCHENGTQFFCIFFPFFDLISLCQHSTHKHSHVWLSALPIPPNQSSLHTHKQTHARSQSHFSFHKHRSLEASAKLFHPPRFLRPQFAICHLLFVFLTPFVFALLCMLSLSWWTTVLFLSLASVSLSLVFWNYQRKGSLEF